MVIGAVAGRITESGMGKLVVGEGLAAPAAGTLDAGAAGGIDAGGVIAPDAAFAGAEGDTIEDTSGNVPKDFLGGLGVPVPAVAGGGGREGFEAAPGGEEGAEADLASAGQADGAAVRGGLGEGEDGGDHRWG